MLTCPTLYIFILINHLANSLKRPDLILIVKDYIQLGKIDIYKRKFYDLIDNLYITRGIIRKEYYPEEFDNILKELNLPNYIPNDILNTYLDKDDQIKTLKKVVTKYQNNYIK